MRRLLAFVLAQALVASGAAGSALHVHAYLGHDHPDHHHGPAAHDHQHSTFIERGRHSRALDNHEPALDANCCDPGRHAVSVTMACTSVTRLHVDLAELAGPRIMVPSVPMQSAMPITDVRVHGPPFSARIPSRAPPATPHA